MKDNLQQQVNSLLKDVDQDNQAGEDEFLKEEKGDTQELQRKENKPRDDIAKDQEVETKHIQAEKKPEDKSLYEKLEAGELDLGGNGSQSLKEEDGLGIIKPSPEEKEEELKSKIKEIELSDKEEELKRQAASANLGYINLKGLPIMPEALRLIPEEESKKEGLICFMYKKGKELRLAVLEKNKQVEQIIDRLKQELEDTPIRIYLTSQASMKAALKTYASLPKIITKTDELAILEEDLKRSAGELKDLKELEARMQGLSTTEILSLILAAAIKVEASDIHIEAEETSIQLRFRVDGMLHDVAQLKREESEKLVSRIKLNSRLKINIKDKPQDGHFSIHFQGKLIDFRVSVLPTAHGESVVMRVLYHQKIQEMTLDNLGIDEYNREILDVEIKKPNGMIVVTGPTGAGKTTTLYAVLNKLNQPANKIITIEDPIEYRLEGINQSEVNPDKGYTFATALKSVVRQDPDIILVGEIRDEETAEICLNAALTGHLVFSTLHTNDATGTISRLLSLGAKPFLLAPAINISVGQRLVRRICLKCKQEDKLSGDDKERVRQELETLPDQHKSKFNFNMSKLKFYKGVGCKECAGLGYKGQIGIFEIFKITDEIRDMILANRSSEHNLKKIAQKNGMITMSQDGVLKAIKGITSLAEVFRVS